MRPIMRVPAVPIAVVLVSMSIAPALAQDDPFTYRGWGPRLGLTLGPDQIHGGVHVDLGYIADRVRVHPNIEVGFGDDLTIVALNVAEAAYRFASTWDVWTPYLGGAMSIYIVDRNGSSTDVGLSAIGGIEKGLADGDRFFVQARLGIVDAPDLGLTVGWTFY